MKLLDLLRADTKCVSVVGSGGKSSLLCELAHETNKSCVLATTTHMLVPDGVRYVAGSSLAEVEAAFEETRVICVGAKGPNHKLCAPEVGIDALVEAGYQVFVEADGSKRLPCKAHAAHEPVIPATSERTIQVIGSKGFGQPIEQVFHRSELVCSDLGVSSDAPATPELVARFLAHERQTLPWKSDVVFVNQADTEERFAASKLFLAALRDAGCEVDVVIGSIFERWGKRLDERSLAKKVTATCQVLWAVSCMR